jgi:hypothetical protein
MKTQNDCYENNGSFNLAYQRFQDQKKPKHKQEKPNRLH